MLSRLVCLVTALLLAAPALRSQPTICSPNGTELCTAQAEINSTGQAARCCVTGGPTFQIVARDLPPNATARMVMGFQPNCPGAPGFAYLRVAPVFWLTANLAANANGTVIFQPGFVVPPGYTLFFQCVYIDPVGATVLGSTVWQEAF